MSDKKKRVAELHERVDDLALQLEKAIRHIGELSKTIETQGKQIATLTKR